MLPSTTELLSSTYSTKYYYKNLVNQIKDSIPAYTNLQTSYMFYIYLDSIYKLNIGLWLLLTNMSDKNDNGQFERIIDELHTTYKYTFDNESIDTFLNRIGIEDLFSFDNTMLDTLNFSILNLLFDNNLDRVYYNKYLNKALTEVFGKFNSYTTQFLNNDLFNVPILASPKSTRYTLNLNDHTVLYYIFNVDVINDVYYNTSISETIKHNTGAEYSQQNTSIIKIEDIFKLDITEKKVASVVINLNYRIINSLAESWVQTPSSTEELEFLAFNT